MNNKAKKFLSIIIMFTLMFTINETKVNAKKRPYDMNETELLYTDSITYHQHEIDNTLTICSYGCSSENKGFEGTNCGNEDERFSRISYNIDDKIWQTEMNIYMYSTRLMRKELGGSTRVIDKTSPSKVYNFSWEGIQDVAPNNAIYFEEPINEGKVNETWEKTDAYNNLQNSFVCPKYLYYDHTLDANTTANEDNNMELCYANTTDKCNSRDENKYTKFSYANNLNYSFMDEINNVLDLVNSEINAIDKSDFLLNYYETEADVCEAFKRYNGTQFSNELDDENYINFINEKLKKHALNSPNERFYNYEIISKLNVKSSGMIEQQYKNLENNYGNKLGESIEYYKNKCTPELSEEEISEYKEEAVQQMTNKINKIEKEFVKELNFDTLTCDELLGDIAEIIGTAYFILEIAAIVIAVALTVLDYAKVILSDDKDSMKKTNQKLLKRLIIVIVILLLPALVNLILTTFNIQNFNSENPLCKINK